ncbi:PDZ and LIM domain protein 7 isoform X7 [Wyeomyia smithii]|uniref:PDZ and LIM domain protein 7 isoform X7 n=1 Tax=Wyeomyia smithii TaxID=174621 RepID=UPI002467C6BF|nr:PDZ and LIM domain protein 7 isoform X7 [Wyeomyia smithii]
MSPKPHDFLVTLRRNSPQIPWGIRLVGGTDLNAPLIITRVQVNSPAQRELLRGDIITKIDQYDARDLAHSDAENLFRNAGNEIKITIRRDDQIALHQSAHQPNGVGAPAPYSPALSPIPLAQPQSQQKPQPHLNFPPPDPTPLLPRVASPLPHGPHAYAAALEHPMNTLPHTVFPKLDASGAYQLPSPYPPAAPYYDESNEAITNQPYRTTPLVLPGAKVPKKDVLPTESYLRHHPNPAMRAPPVHDITDTLMKQKIVHKQFNSPIGLYSDSNIENTVRNTAPQQNQAVPIFIDLSFLKQKRAILEEQRRVDKENELKNKYPFPSYASSSSLHSSSSGHSSPSPYAQQQHQQPPRQQTLSPPPVPPLPSDYFQSPQQ